MIRTDEFENEIIDIRRVSKVTKGGRNLRFRVTMVIGDRKGRVGVGVGNKVLILEYSFYSVISPEGCASILFRDAKKADIAAERQRITAKDLLELKVVDEIIKEPIGGAHFDPKKTFKTTKKYILDELFNLSKLTNIELRDTRIKKYRDMGFFQRFNYDNLGGVRR